MGNKKLIIISNNDIRRINNLINDPTSPFHNKSWQTDGFQVDMNNLYSCNEILGITTASIEVGPGLSMTSPVLKLHIINNVYITSPTLGNYNTIAPFSNNVIKKFL
jgi:hypothetical protein